MQNKCLGAKQQSAANQNGREQMQPGPAYITNHSGVVNQVVITPAVAAIT